MGNPKGTAYEQVTRTMVVELKSDIGEVKESIKNLDEKQSKMFSSLETKNTEMFNHMSRRLPLWVTILFTILGSLVVGLIIKFVS